MLALHALCPLFLPTIGRPHSAKLRNYKLTTLDVFSAMLETLQVRRYRRYRRAVYRR